MTKTVYVMLYKNRYCIRPAITWAVALHAVERMEVVRQIYQHCI